MHKKTLYLSVLLIFALGVGACGAPAAPPTTAPTTVPAVDAPASQTAAAVANNNQAATSVAATLTPQPTNTPQPTDTATPKPSATSTTAPTARPTATRTKAPVIVATKAPATDVPAPTAAAAESVYSTASGGPQGYLSTLGCAQANHAPCQPIMAPGDVSFSIRLESTADALLEIFVPFGLAVEKDGANVADMYMTVDAGWLQPGSVAHMGTSRSFNQLGHYVVRTNGCLITEASYPACTWWTVNGTVVTFDIQ